MKNCETARDNGRAVTLRTASCPLAINRRLQSVLSLCAVITLLAYNTTELRITNFGLSLPEVKLRLRVLGDLLP